MKFHSCCACYPIGGDGGSVSKHKSGEGQDAPVADPA